METAVAANILKKYWEINLIYEQSCVNGTPNAEVKAQMDAVKAQADEHVAKAKAFRKEAWDKYHGKDILPITERTLDPAYQQKLDGNYETGINLGKLTNNEMRELRSEMQMIFQDPAASLDPRQSVGKSIEEVFVINTDYTPAVRKEKVMELLEQVGLKREHYYSYPHALSG